jgi:uracil DNA glycosylase
VVDIVTATRMGTYIFWGKADTTKTSKMRRQAHTAVSDSRRSPVSSQN